MNDWTAAYARVRALTEELIAGLEPEDCQLQASPEVSPLKWHLAHSTWFFETFVLERYGSDYRTPCAAYHELFNSYYLTLGDAYPRTQRGLLSRPTLREVLDYRHHVDDSLCRLLEGSRVDDELMRLVELGLHHEQQHQELLVMDAKLNFSKNPLRPAFRDEPLPPSPRGAPLAFLDFAGGLMSFGHRGEGFSFDNERPAHPRFVAPFALATRLINNAEMLEFVEAGGYRTPALWLAEGWDWLQQRGVQMPLYWRRTKDGSYREFTAHGEGPLDLQAPVCHVSLYEATAYASFVGARLPTEFEWELAARAVGPSADARWLQDFTLHPRAGQGAGVTQLFGDAWEWTRSAYEPYPGFTPEQGALGEYSGKFMCQNWVLRGGSVASPRGHLRATYRNFFQPRQCWAFSGIRLAREAA